MQVALDHLAALLDHVVAQVVEAELVVGAIGNVGGIGFLAADRPEVQQPAVGVVFIDKLRVEDERRVVDDDAGPQPQLVVDRPHPAAVPP